MKNRPFAALAAVLALLCWAIGQPGRPSDCMSGRFVHVQLHWPYDFCIGCEESVWSLGGLRVSYPKSFRRAIAGVKHGWIPEIKILRGEVGWSDRRFCQTWTCHGETLISVNKSSWDREIERREYCRKMGVEP